MALAQLIYVSGRTVQLTPEVLGQIVTQSTGNNARRDISGVLLCSGPNLMQLLEGELAEIVNLYESIRQDLRHRDVRCLVCKNVVKRLFPDWGMGLADLDAESVLDRDRLTRLVEDIRLTTNTSHYAVEARVLLNDFRQQIARGSGHYAPSR